MLSQIPMSSAWLTIRTGASCGAFLKMFPAMRMPGSSLSRIELPSMVMRVVMDGGAELPRGWRPTLKSAMPSSPVPRDGYGEPSQNPVAGGEVAKSG